jgi:hypothetical protein
MHACTAGQRVDWPRAVLIAAQRAGYFAPAPIWDDLRSFDARAFHGPSTRSSQDIRASHSVLPENAEVPTIRATSGPK